MRTSQAKLLRFVFALGLLSFGTSAWASDAEHESSDSHGASDSASAHEPSVTESEPELPVLRIPESVHDITLPSNLWEMISGRQLLVGSVTFFPISMEVEEKTKGVLKQPAFRVQFPKGGGNFDLHQMVRPVRGTFFVRFPKELGEAGAKVFFVSRSPEIEIQGRKVGGGCHRFFEVTKGVWSASQGQGLAFNTSEDRHVLALGGSFVFVIAKGAQVEVAQVTFFDSQKKQWTCPPRGEVSK